MKTKEKKMAMKAAFRKTSDVGSMDGIEYYVTAAKNGKGYVWVSPTLRGNNFNIPSSGFHFDERGAYQDAELAIDNYLDRVMEGLLEEVRKQGPENGSCPICSNSTLYDEEYGVCAECGYYRDGPEEGEIVVW